MIYMKYLLLPTLIGFLFVFSSCQNSYQQNVPDAAFKSPVVGVSADAFQVTVDEYEKYFESRYGLLYQKFNDRPFSGRILTIDQGQSGDYISSDENWKEGKKDGLSARWFSNGMKMYERNYSEGRWHGTVTRWWPNGQKMYIRAYTNGTRHGKEATWRSDGSPINISAKSFLPKNEGTPGQFPSGNKGLPSQDVKSPDTGSLPSVSIPSIPGFVPSSPVVEPMASESPSFLPESIPVLPEVPQDNSSIIPSDDGFPSLPEIESTPSNDLPVIPDSSLPEFPSGSGDLPTLPSFPEPGANDLPAFPESPSTDNGLPPLPSLPESGGDKLPAFPESPSTDNGLPPLPGLPESGANDLPPLPGLPDDGSGGLPPLPGADSSDGGLPPLPPLPELE
jgi:hypothetical protein